MKKIYIFILLTLLCSSICRADNPPKVLLDGEELTLNDMPIIEGPFSTYYFRSLIAAKLLGLDYYYYTFPPVGSGQGYKRIVINRSNIITQEEQSLLDKRLLCGPTHYSFLDLIDNKSDLIITQRCISDEEKAYAEEQGVTLLEKPIAIDALAIIVNKSNPVNNLSVGEIQGIYTGNITNWSMVDGNDANINAYLLPSYLEITEHFNTMVMDGHATCSLTELDESTTMLPEHFMIINDQSGIVYTPYYYYNFLFNRGKAKAVGVDGVPMTRENILNGTYPYVTNVYAAVRSDIDKSSVAYKIYEFLTTYEGQNIVDESGYIPLTASTDIRNVSKVNAEIEFRNHAISIISEEPAQRLEITDMQGRTLFHENVISNNISVPSDMRGLYMVSVWFANGEKLAKKVMMY